MGGRGSGSNMTGGGRSAQQQTSLSTNANVQQQINSLPVSRGVSNLQYSDIQPYERALSQLPVNTQIRLNTEAGTDTYRKTSGGRYSGEWEVSIAPHNDPRTMSEFDLSRRLAGRGNIARGNIVIR